MAEVEALGDLRVRPVLGYEGQDLVLPLGHLGEDIFGLAARAREVAHQPPGDGRAKDRLPAHDRPNRAPYLRLQGALEQVAAGVGLEGGEDRLVVEGSLVSAKSQIGPTAIKTVPTRGKTPDR